MFPILRIRTALIDKGVDGVANIHVDLISNSAKIDHGAFNRIGVRGAQAV